MVFLLSCAEVEAGEASPLRSPELLTERARTGGTMAGPPLPLVDRRLGGALADRRLVSSCRGNASSAMLVHVPV